MVNTLEVSSSPRYLRHKGKSVPGIWDVGFTRTLATRDEAMELSWSDRPQNQVGE